jgi:hypothetical protein
MSLRAAIFGLSLRVIWRGAAFQFAEQLRAAGEQVARGKFESFPASRNGLLSR